MLRALRPKRWARTLSNTAYQTDDKQETKRSKRYNPAAMEQNSQKQALIHQRYDKAYKLLLGNREVFCRFMRSLVDEELAQKVAPENIEMVDKSYISRGGREYVSDLIYKISVEPEHEAYFYILMEFQSRPDKWMALRILNYIVQFYQSLSNKGKLPAIFPIVLYNGDREWNAKTEISQCIENKWIPEKYIPKMSYYLIDISKVQNLKDNLVSSVVYAEQQDNTREDYLDNLEHLAQKIVPLELKQAFADWFTLISTGTMPKDDIERIKYSLKEKEENMLATFGERIYNEGIEKGREEGIEKGIEKGIERGRIEVAKNMLANGLDIKQVARCSGFSLEAVRRLNEAD